MSFHPPKMPFALPTKIILLGTPTKTQSAAQLLELWEQQIIYNVLTVLRISEAYLAERRPDWVQLVQPHIRPGFHDALCGGGDTLVLQVTQNLPDVDILDRFRYLNARNTILFVDLVQSRSASSDAASILIGYALGIMSFFCEGGTYVLTSSGNVIQVADAQYDSQTGAIVEVAKDLKPAFWRTAPLD